jgi:hypothetical protein
MLLGFPKKTVAMVLLTTLLIATGSYYHVSAQKLFSWNTYVSCTPVLTTVGKLLGPDFNQTTGGALENGPFGMVVESSLHPPCTAPNVNGTIAPTFVEIHSLRLNFQSSVEDLNGGKCRTSYTTANGGGSYANNATFCNSYSLFRTDDYSGNCSTLSTIEPKTCIRMEIDADWKASGQCGCDIQHFDNLTQNVNIDVQGFVTWHPPSAPGHGYSSWEIHPLTGWKFSPVDPSVDRSLPMLSIFLVIFAVASAVVAVGVWAEHHRSANKKNLSDKTARC